MDSYPFNIPAIGNLDSMTFNSKVTFLVGENGSGKSTLLEAIAIALGFNPEGGSKNFNFSTEDTCSELHDHIKVSKGYIRPKDGFFLRAESFYNVATNIDTMDREGSLGAPLIGSYGGKSLHCQSHGESFFSLLMNRFFGNGIYILDEPEAALSPSRQLSAISRIHQLVEQSSQFIIATHSPLLLAYPHSTIYSFSDAGISRVDYEDTEHFQITKYFMNNRERMLRELLS